MLYIRESKRGADGFGNKGIGKGLVLDIVRLCRQALLFSFRCNHHRELHGLYTNQQQTTGLLESDETFRSEMLHAYDSADDDARMRLISILHAYMRPSLFVTNHRDSVTVCRQLHGILSQWRDVRR